MTVEMKGQCSSVIGPGWRLLLKFLTAAMSAIGTISITVSMGIQSLAYSFWWYYSFDHSYYGARTELSAGNH